MLVLYLATNISLSLQSCVKHRFMKKALFTLLMLCFSLFGHAIEPVIEPELLAVMNSMGNDEEAKICILMSEQSDPTFLLLEAERHGSPDERRQYVVTTLQRQAEASQAELMDLLMEMESNGRVEDIQSLWIVNAVCCKATKTAISDLAQRRDILSISYCEQARWIFEEEAMPALRGNGREITQNLLQVNAPQVWEQGYTGQDVVVAIIDTGVNYDHADLAGRLWDGGSSYPHHGYDFSDYDNDPMDRHGHGTHVAGTVCGTGVSGSQTGIAPSATIMALKAFNDQGEGDETQWIAAMQFALEHGADVINMSLGRPQPNVNQKRMTRQACDNTLAAGIVASVCAGNIRQMQFMVPTPYNIYTPGDCPPPMLHHDQMINAGGTSCVICVGAVDYNDNIAAFSSEGPSQWADVPEYGDYPYVTGSADQIGLLRPDLCAPGVQIKSLDCNDINGYTLMDGTSMATPLVTGTIALMLSKDRELTPGQIDQILESTAFKITEQKSNDYGSGRLDVLAAVNAVDYDALVETNPCQAQVYPNPSTGVVTIHCEGLKRVEVLSVDGRKVKNVEVNGSQCQINSLESGIYLVRVISDSGVTTRTIVCSQ